MKQTIDVVRLVLLFIAACAVALATVSCVARSAADVPHRDGTEEPQYGGRLNVGTVYVTLSPLSWDTADWNWKANHDTGVIYEQLFSGDLDKSVRKGGKHRFVADAWIPEDAVRGELAESWEWEDDLTLVIQIRRGAMIQAKPGVVEQTRELDAHDVVFSFDRLNTSPKRITTYFDHIDRVEARDDFTVVFHFNQYNAEWDYRFGWGYYSGIVPREMGDVDAKDWRNLTGTGPFELIEYVQTNSQTYARNENYWDRETLNGKDYSIPFVDEVKYRIIKDEATFLTALRTAKIDILESMRWIAVDHLKKSTPELQWNRRLSTDGNFMVMRMDMEPFDDLRVRRAMNLAVNQQEIVDLFYGGHAELFAYPQHTDFAGFYQPLEEMPEAVQELYTYDPEKAKQLLAEAGYPDGFTFKSQVSTANPSAMDLMPLLADYFADIGVTMEIEPLEYAAFLSQMTSGNHGPGRLMNSGHVSPTTTIRKNFQTGQLWNPSYYSNPEFDTKLTEMFETRDSEKRRLMIRELTAMAMEDAPYVFLPIQYVYTAWWPWVRNYSGELRVGAVRPGPIYARMWIDQEMKREMGF